jgi:predicted O-methyltransferase YrrM
MLQNDTVIADLAPIFSAGDYGAFLKCLKPNLTGQAKRGYFLLAAIASDRLGLFDQSEGLLCRELELHPDNTEAATVMNELKGFPISLATVDPHPTVKPHEILPGLQFNPIAACDGIALSELTNGGEIVDNVAQGIRAIGIDGWLRRCEGLALFELAAVGPGAGKIVEIGSFKGLSTVWLASGSKLAHREHVFAIDPHTGSPEHQKGGSGHDRMPPEGTTRHVFMRNLKLAGVSDYVEPIIATSAQAAAQWQEPIRLMFIDGAHEYEAVRLDFELWSKFVIPGGVIAFHDVTPTFPGPIDVVREVLSGNSGFTLAGTTSTTAILQKRL